MIGELNANQLLILNFVSAILLPWVIGFIKQQGWDDVVSLVLSYIIYTVWTTFTIVVFGEKALGDYSLYGYVELWAVTAITGYTAFKVFWSKLPVYNRFESATG